MKSLLLDTNVVSILFNRNHPLRNACIDVVAGNYLAVSFMTRAELLLWPTANRWGEQRRTNLLSHLELYTTVYADECTCAIWVDVVDKCKRAGRRIQTADAWIASIALQWGVPLVTADFRDYAAVDDLEVLPIGAFRSSTSG